MYLAVLVFEESVCADVLLVGSLVVAEEVLGVAGVEELPPPEITSSTKSFFSKNKYKYTPPLNYI